MPKNESAIFDVLDTLDNLLEEKPPEHPYDRLLKKVVDCRNVPEIVDGIEDLDQYEDEVNELAHNWIGVVKQLRKIERNKKTLL